MARDTGGSEALVKLIRKDVRRLDATVSAAISHCKLIRDLARNPALHLGEAQKIGLKAMKTAASADQQSARLWAAVRAATAKLPREARKANRREIERALAVLDGKIEKLARTARGLVDEVEKVVKQKPPAGAGHDPLTVSIQFLRAMVTIWKVWQKRKNKALK